MLSRLMVAVVTLIAVACGGGTVNPTQTPSTSEEASSAPAVVNAGPIEEYESGEPVHFFSEGFWLVRVGDDLVLALSDRDTHPNFSDERCRIVWRPDAVIDARYGWFRGRCSGSMFNVNGRFDYGIRPP